MDTFGLTTQLNYTVCFPLLGKWLEVRSNHADVLHAAERTFGHWLALPADEITTQEQLRVDVLVTDDAPNQSSPTDWPFKQRVHGHTFVATLGQDILTAQLDRGYAIAFVSAALAANTTYLQKQVLDTLGLLITTQRDREPIHAGAVAWQGKALVLAGKSKVGKSTLCYACAQAGFALLAEDVIYIQRQPRLRVWGHSQCVHLLADAPRFFPELRNVPVQRLPNGKAKLAAAVAHTRRFAERCALCIIERWPQAHSEVQPLQRDDALTALFAGLDEGFHLYPRAREAAEELLTHNPCYTLRVGHDLDRAVELLKTL